MKQIGGIIGILFFFFGSFFAQEKTGREITERLCKPDFFGRGYVRKGDSLAGVYLAEQFKKRGLKSLSPNYLQAFSHPVNIFPGEMLMQVDSLRLVPGVDFLVDPSSNKIFAELTPKWEEGIALLNQGYMENLLRETQGARSWNVLVLNALNLKNDSLRTVKKIAELFTDIVSVLLVTDEKFTYSVGHEPRKKTLVYVKPGFISPETRHVILHIDQQFDAAYESYNVVALLPASKRSKKTILFTAHYDHLGGIGSEVYFPGANDNASGTSMLFAMADELKKRKKRKYNYVFIAFAGEEAGLVGSRYFVDNPLVQLSKVRMVVNLDIMGSGEDGVTVVNGSVFQKEFDLLTQINNDKKYLKQVKIRGKAANSDHYWFSEKGIPAFFIYTMGSNKNYHDVFDTYDALTFEAYNSIVRLLLDFTSKLEQAK